jgi:energy-coupling factor transporter ATP-binding protein EcfA2
VSDFIDSDEMLLLYRDVVAAVDEVVKAAFDALGRFNLLVVGDSGAGKSTLVNAMFGIAEAATGIGRPVTMEIKRYPDDDDSIITAFDTQGFELGTNSRELISSVTEIIRQRRGLPIRDQIHAVWFVVNPWTARFLDGHAEIVTALHELSLPVAIVFTRVPRLGSEINEEVLELVRQVEERRLPVAGDGKVVLVNSKDLKQTGGPTIPPHGLRDLLDATLDMAPLAAAAIRAGQRIDFTMQRDEAKKIIRNFRYISATAGMTAAAPVPMADVGAVALSVAVMIGKISVCYGLPIRRTQISALAGATVLGVGAGQKGTGKAGQWLARRAAARASEGILSSGAAREGAGLAAKAAATRTVQKGAEGAAKAVAGEIAKEGAEQAAKAVAEQIIKEGTEQVAKTAGEQAAMQGAKQIGKFIPVVNIVFGLVGAGSATLLAKAVGHAWMYVCEYLLRHPSRLENVEIQKILKIYWHFFERRGSFAPGDGPEPAEPAL